MSSKSMLGVLATSILAFGCSAEVADFSEDEGVAAIEALSAERGPKVFIVRLAEGVDVDDALEELNARHGAGITHRYRHALRGGALLVPNEAARAELLADPRVAGLDEDRPVQAIGKPAPSTTPPAEKEPTGYRLIGADVTGNEGQDIRVAVLDTGIDFDHSDLFANVDLGPAKDCVNESGVTYDDNNGHGTHVAGTIAAVDNDIGSIGVGTELKVVPVKVLNRRGSGSWSTIICGIDHVTANSAALRVANMSLGGSGTECSTSSCTKSSLQIAVERSVAAGVTYAVAAGNDGIEASKSVPAAYDAVITVSAYKDGDGNLGSGDGWASFTNYGADVDIAAPGVSIFSTWKSNGYNTISGTSMASPHVAAAAGLFLATHPNATPADVLTALLAPAKTTYPGSTDPKHREPLLDVRSF